jgi:hypothetical protein
MIEWLDERRGGRREQDLLLRSDVVRSLAEVARLTRAVERPSSIAVLGSACQQTERIFSALTGTASQALGQFQGGLTRLPAIDGLLPRGKHGGQQDAALIIRYSHENPADAAAKSVDTVGRLLLTSTDDPTQRVADGTVRLQLLSLSDVVNILGRAYFANVRGESVSRVATEVASELARVKADDVSVAMQTGLAGHHIYDLRHAFEQRFRGHPTLLALEACGYWDTFAAMAPRLSVDGRRRLVSLLWGGMADYDAVFGELSEALDGLNHAVEIMCPAEAVRNTDRSTGWGDAHLASVLAVDTLLGIDASANEIIHVRTRFGQPWPLPRSTIAMLACEVNVRLEGDIRAPMAKTDILRLPVAEAVIRPRCVGVADVTDRDTGSWIARAFLQAKLLHLCDGVVASQEVALMVASITPDHPIGDAFIPMLDEWVAVSAGRTPVARETNDVPLFVAVGADQGVDAPCWSALDHFVASLGVEVDWLEQWGVNRAFDHVFLLGPSIAADRLLSVIRNAAPASELLLGTQSGALAPFRHVRNATTAIEEAIGPGDGGVRYLAECIAAIDCERVKSRQIANRLSDVRRNLVDGIHRFLLSSHPAQDNDWRLRAALATVSRLGSVTKQNRLGHLIAALGVSEAEIRALFDQAAAETTRIDTQTTTDAEVLGRLPARFAARVIDYWLRSMRSLGRSAGTSQRFGFTELTFAPLIDEIVLGAVRHDLKHQIASTATEAIAAASGPAQSAARASAETRDILSTYLANLGFDNPWSTRHPKRRGTAAAPLFERRLPPGGVNALAVRDQAHRIAAQYGADWCEAFTVLTEENIAASRGMRFEDREFREMEELLTMLGSNARELTL